MVSPSRTVQKTETSAEKTNYISYKFWEIAQRGIGRQGEMKKKVRLTCIFRSTWFFSVLNQLAMGTEAQTHSFEFKCVRDEFFGDETQRHAPFPFMSVNTICFLFGCLHFHLPIHVNLPTQMYFARKLTGRQNEPWKGTRARWMNWMAKKRQQSDPVVLHKGKSSLFVFGGTEKTGSHGNDGHNVRFINNNKNEAK